MINHNKNMKKACVIGDPVEHSLSPLLHNRWIKARGLMAKYSLCRASAAQFAQTVEDKFNTPGFVGMNVTLPHKEAAFKLAEQASPAAKSIGAANLLIKKSGKIYAHNTDVEGFCAPLLAHQPAPVWHNKTLVIIGAGGAARAVLAGAQTLKFKQIVLVNRTDARAQALVQDCGEAVVAINWSKRETTLPRADLLVNASRAGMKGGPPLDFPLDGLKSGAVVYDLIYTPINTPLLKAAQAGGHPTLGGLDMLIAQARPSFEAFFGVPAPKALPGGEDIKALLIRALERGA
jgi:shikimate dehydrogenase